MWINFNLRIVFVNMSYKNFFFILALLCSSLYPTEVFQTNRTIYTPKSLIFFKIALNKDSYIYILNQTVTGTIHLLFPNPEDSENYFTKGNYRIPNITASYEFQLEEDTGEEIFYLIVSKVKISKLHLRNFRENESLAKTQWLRRFTSELHPLDWKIYEQKIKIVEN